MGPVADRQGLARAPGEGGLSRVFGRKAALGDNPQVSSDARRNLFGLDLSSLGEILTSLGQPAYRAGQVYGWLYARRARAVGDMTDLPKALRENLSAGHDLRWPEVVERQHSSDGTLKLLFRLEGEATIESVYIPELRRRTICISTQAGCPVKCAFCLTGISGYKRNLKAAEILSQVAHVMNEAAPSSPRDERPWNVVVMGMGEPLLNYENLSAALDVVHDEMGLGARKITVSTVGFPERLNKLAPKKPRFQLAISLHTPFQEQRDVLVPASGADAARDILLEAELTASGPSAPPVRAARVAAGLAAALALAALAAWLGTELLR